MVKKYFPNIYGDLEETDRTDSFTYTKYSDYAALEEKYNALVSQRERELQTTQSILEAEMRCPKCGDESGYPDHDCTGSSNE